MQRALLSLAVIAASGAYVVYQDHSAQQQTQDSAAVQTSLPQSAAPATAAVSKQPAAVADAAPSAFVVTSPTAAPPTPVQELTDLADAAPVKTATVGEPINDIVPPSVPAVPLPRPRPIAPAAIEPAAAQSVAQAASGYRDGTFQGVSANAYYGRVEVDAVVQGGQLVRVDILDYPSDRRTSRNINSRALPELQQEAIQAQSANIDTVSGATLSSEAFIQSLDSALQHAHGSGGGNA